MSRTLHEPPAVRACRYLLRHLDDPAALAEDPFVRRHAGSDAKGTDIRRILRALAGDLNERSRAILLRCDLAGEPHKQVAHALGLSMRQFYRDRASMIKGLAALIDERGGPRATIIDVGRLALARASVMQFSGQRSKAIELLRSIAASVADDDVRIAAQCAALEICIEEGAFDDACAELMVLESLAEVNPLMRARIDHERRTYLWCTGREIEAIALGDRSMESVALFARAGGSAEREFAASALAILGRQAFMCGRFDEARKRLDLAQDAQALADHPPAWSRINLLIFSGVLRTITRAARELPRELLEAWALATNHGLTELLVLTVIALSVDDQLRGDAPTALSRMEQILPIAREACSNLNHAHVCLRLAELRIAAGDPVGALHVLQDARSAVPARNYTWTYNSLLASHAYTAIHDFTSAGREAEHAASAARSQRNERIEGVAMLALADSRIGLNVKSEAVAAVEHAIECLERCGYPSELLRAYRIAGLLTGRRRFTERARELEHALKL